MTWTRRALYALLALDIAAVWLLCNWELLPPAAQRALGIN